MNESCLGCGSANVASLYDAREVPVHIGVQWSTRDEAIECPKGDIRLALCRDCGLISNIAFDAEKLDYEHAYDNALDFSPTFQEYAHALATRLIESHGLRNKTVIDVGCGKGEFLKLICALGDNRGFGFDPTYEGQLNAGSEQTEITFIRDYYSADYKSFQGDLLACRQVFEHVADPRAFLAMLRNVIGDRLDTLVFFEVPNGEYVLRDMALWTIIYEHCSYFTPAALRALFSLSGFHVRDVFEAYESQFLGIEAVPVTGEVGAGDLHRDIEETQRLVNHFSERCRTKIRQWRDALDRLQDGNKRVVMWGAGARTVGFVNGLGITDQIPYAVDINPRKAGKYLPGTGQEIVSPDFLKTYRPDVIIVMNAIYQAEIERDIRRMGLDVEYMIA